LWKTASEITHLLTDNAADFPALPVDMITFGGLAAAFYTILCRPVYPEKSGDLKAARKAVLKALKKNGVYINEHADGDRVLLGRSGYPLGKPRYPVGALSQTRIKKVTSIMNGFDIELIKVAGARVYIVCVMPSASVIPNDYHYKKWPWYPFAKTKGRISDLESSVKFTLVAVALGSNPKLTFSTPVEHTTQ